MAAGAICPFHLIARTAILAMATVAVRTFTTPISLPNPHLSKTIKQNAHFPYLGPRLNANFFGKRSKPRYASPKSIKTIYLIHNPQIPTISNLQPPPSTFLLPSPIDPLPLPRYHHLDVSELEELYRRIASCPDCNLCHNRTHAVPGEGPPDAEIMFVGEAPGFYEDQQARPFVGPAGRFLDELIASIGFRREQVYITNVIKCRPPDNRDPLPTEIEACRKHLQRQIELIRPKVVVTLGRYSLAWFFPRDSIGKVHGQARVRDGIHYICMYHPAAALHAGNMRNVIEEDFRRIPAVLEKARQAVPVETALQPEPEQMRLL